MYLPLQAGLEVLLQDGAVFTCDEANDNVNALQMVAAMLKANKTISSLSTAQQGDPTQPKHVQWHHRCL